MPATYQALSLQVTCSALSHIVGTITIEAEEGLARIATVTGAPATSPVNLSSLIGTPISIRFKQEVVFTGKVDTPSYDALTGLLTLECSDRLPKFFDGQSRFSILRILESGLPSGTIAWHPAIFDENASNWEFVQDAMSTVPWSADLDSHGLLRFSPWQASTPIQSFNANDVLDISVHLAGGDELINTVDLTISFRYERIFQRKQNYSWNFLSPGALSWSDVALNEIPVPTTDAVMSAITGSDWLLAEAPKLISPNSVENLNYQTDGGPGITYQVPGQLSFSPPSDYCIYASFILEKRWAQQITEAKTIRVFANKSSNAVGEKIETLTFSVDPDYSSWWFYNVYQMETNNTALATGGNVATSTTSGYTPTTHFTKYRFPFDDGATATTEGVYMDSDTAPVVNEIKAKKILYDVPYTLSAFISGTTPGMLKVTTREVEFTQPIFPDLVSRRYSLTFNIPKPATAGTNLYAEITSTITGDNVTGAMLTIGNGLPALYRNIPFGGDPPTYREYFTDAVKVATNLAKNKVLSSHRRNLVTFTVPMHPGIERHHTVSVNTTRPEAGGISATGKVFKITHTIDTAAGSAISTIQLALTLPYAGSDSPSDTTPYGKATLPASVKYRYDPKKFGKLGTYIGRLPGVIPPHPLFKETITGVIEPMKPSIDPATKEPVQLYGYIADAKTPQNFTTNIGTLYGYGDNRFAIKSPPIEARNLYPSTISEQGTIAVNLEINSLVITPPTLIT